MQMEVLSIGRVELERQGRWTDFRGIDDSSQNHEANLERVGEARRGGREEKEGGQGCNSDLCESLDSWQAHRENQAVRPRRNATGPSASSQDSLVNSSGREGVDGAEIQIEGHRNETVEVQRPRVVNHVHRQGPDKGRYRKVQEWALNNHFLSDDHDTVPRLE